MATNLVIQTAFLGDALLTIPLLKRIKAASEDSLTFVVRKGVGSFFLRTGLADEVFEVEKGNRASYNKVLSELQKRNLKTILAAHSSWRTHFFVASLRAQNKVGFSRFGNRFFFDQRVDKDLTLPDALRQLTLLTPFDENLEALLKKYRKEKIAYELEPSGKLSAPPEWATLSMREKLLADRGTWARFLEQSGFGTWRDKPWALIFPGSVWATKRWTPEGYAQVAESLLKQHHHVFLMGAPDEKELCQRIAKLAPGAQVLAGQTSIYESALILAHAAVAIGNDSASMHLASCAETPLISIFGPTMPEFGFRPWSAHAGVVQEADLPCRPCGPHGHRKCPLKTHRCMTDIDARRVLRAVEDIAQFPE